MATWTPSTTGDSADDVRTLLARILAAEVAASAPSQSAWVDYLASAARTASTTGGTIDATGYSGIVVMTNVTAMTAGTLQFELQDADNSNARLAISATGMTSATRRFMLFQPRITASLFELTEPRYCFIPRSVAFRVVHSTADSWTYSVRYCLLR